MCMLCVYNLQSLHAAQYYALKGPTGAKDCLKPALCQSGFGDYGQRLRGLEPG